jgi:hypothetical protein
MIFTSREVWVRFSGWIYRDKEPAWLWYEVASLYIIGITFIGNFFLKI